MPKTRTPQLILRSSGWEVKKQHKVQTSEETEPYLISSVPAPQPPSMHSSPPRPANDAAADTGAARRDSPAATAMLPRPGGDRGVAAEAAGEHEPAAQVVQLGPDTALRRWPATLALLPNGCISGFVACPELSTALTRRHCFASVRSRAPLRGFGNTQPVLCTGHVFIGQGRSIGLAGEEVVEEDCFYATDRRLMRMVLHDFDSGQDVSLLADRTGGDSMSLQAPPQVI